MRDSQASCWTRRKERPGKIRSQTVKVRVATAIFEPLNDPDYFRLMRLDTRCGTVVWPNGADFAPEALWELEDLASG